MRLDYIPWGRPSRQNISAEEHNKQDNIYAVKALLAFAASVPIFLNAWSTNTKIVATEMATGKTEPGLGLRIAEMAICGVLIVAAHICAERFAQHKKIARGLSADY